MENNSRSAERDASRRGSIEADVEQSFIKFDISVIRANTPHYSSDAELKSALREEKSVIVIRDKRLSNETVLWMTFGQCLRHGTLVSALGAIVCSSGMNDTLFKVAKPLAVGSLVMNIGYHSFWHHRPLNQYRIAQGPSIGDIQNGDERANTVIVRRVVEESSVVHTFATAVAVMSAFWKEIRSFDIVEGIGSMIRKTEEKLDEQEPEIGKVTEKIKKAFK